MKPLRNPEDHTLMTIYFHGSRHKHIEREAAELGLTYIPLKGNHFALATKEFEQDGYAYSIPKVLKLRGRVDEKKLPILGPEWFSRQLANNLYFRNVIERMERLQYNLSELEYQYNDDVVVTLPAEGDKYIRYSHAVKAFQPYCLVLRARFSVLSGDILFDKSGNVLVPDYIYKYGRDEIECAINAGLIASFIRYNANV